MTGIARIACLAMLLGLLAGCDVASRVGDVASSVVDTVAAPLDGSGAKTDSAETGPVDTISFAGAYCQGDTEAALAATRELFAAHPRNPRVRLVHGMALDLSGQGIAAYRMLQPLAVADLRLPAVLKCGKDFVYSGSISDVAERRLFDIRTRLTALGVTFPLPRPDEARQTAKYLYAFAASAPVTIVDRPAPMKIATAVPLGPTAGDRTAADKTPGPDLKPQHKPARHSARPGRKFVHLDSYRTLKALNRGWRILQKRYGKVLASGKRTVTHVDLGRTKGKFLRLGIAVKDERTAQSVCRKMKAHGQYCAIMPYRKG